MFTVHLLMLELFKRLCHCTMILSFVNRASIKIKVNSLLWIPLLSYLYPLVWPIFCNFNKGDVLSKKSITRFQTWKEPLFVRPGQLNFIHYKFKLTCHYQQNCGLLIRIKSSPVIDRFTTSGSSITVEISTVALFQIRNADWFIIDIRWMLTCK